MNIVSLLEKAKLGDISSEQEIFQYLLVRFGLFARQRIRDRQAAEEVAHEACIIVLEKYKMETFKVGFEPWAWGVLRIKIKNYFHQLSIQAGRETDKSQIEETSAATDIDPELERNLIECLKKIAGKTRRFARILNLFYQGYKTNEVCEKLSINRNSCHVTLHRGRSMLKKCLETGEV